MNLKIQEEREFREFFGQRLRIARRQANLSQKGLAYHLKIGQDTISKYECGKVVPNALLIFQLARVLDVEVEYFFPDYTF